MSRRIGPWLPALLLLLGGTGAARGQTTLGRGVEYLRTRALGGLSVGESGIVGLALIKADVPHSDPAVAACLNKALGRFQGEDYTPELEPGPDIYEAAVVGLMLAGLDSTLYRPRLHGIARFLLAHQQPSGAWDYYKQRSQGDTSISQYALLALWELQAAGVAVPPQVWDDAAGWYVSRQGADGGWRYHPDQPGWTATVSMTAAGVGSLLICQRQLASIRPKRVVKVSPLMTPLVDASSPFGPGRFERKTSPAAIKQAIDRGTSWLGQNFTTSDAAVIGQSPYYALYGIERMETLAGSETLGGVRWYERGVQYISATQQENGSWTAHHGEAPNSAWAVLFLVRATRKTLARIEPKKLGQGTLLGGKGLPEDLSTLTVAGGRVLVRPMNGAIEGMFAVLADPRNQDDAAAVAGLVEQYREGGPDVLRPHVDRLRRLLRDRDPKARAVAAWALARTGIVEVAPELIAALNDPADDVVHEAVAGLELLSRKLDGYGPEPGATPEQIRRAAERWRAWYETVRPADAAAAAEAAARAEAGGAADEAEPGAARAEPVP